MHPKLQVRNSGARRSGARGAVRFIDAAQETGPSRSLDRRRHRDHAFHEHAAVVPWSGETGKIDEAFIRRIAAELANSVYYVAGPPAMVGALRDALERAGVDADDIRSEDFYGY